MLGDTVVKADFKGNRVQAVYSINHGDISFVAENFVLASGSYFSNGLVARPDSVIEPVLAVMWILRRAATVGMTNRSSTSRII